MKKIIYLSNGLSKEKYNEIYEKYGEYPKQQMQQYNLSLTKGFGANDGYLVEALSVYPSISNSLSKLVTLASDEKKSYAHYYYAPYSSNRVLRQILIFIYIFFFILFKSSGETIIISDALNIVSNLALIIASKARKKKSIGILTDLPEFMGLKGATLGLLHKIVASFDAYVFLSEPMNKKINFHNKPYVVVEGQIEECGILGKDSLINEDNKKRNIVYAGSLTISNGVARFIEAFEKCNLTNVELHLYGKGELVSTIDFSKSKNIVYKGQVPSSELKTILKKATLLVNPRPTDQEFVQYSFPSKQMEYMASGTPVLTTHIPSMPDEYLDYVLVIKDESIDGMTRSIIEAMKMTDEQLLFLGQKAREFVYKNKIGRVQARKILDMSDRI